MRKMIKILLILAIIYFITAFILYFIQEKIVFQGVDLPDSHVYDLPQKFEEVTLKTDKSTSINALHFKVENPKGVILYFHGNRGNLERWGNITRYFTVFNYDVFVMDYRNYGKSKGTFNEELMYGDAQFCYNYIKKQYPENKITIYGRSLGCTFAIKTASQNKPKQLILEAPFYSLSDVAKYHYPFMPFGFLLKYKFESYKFIGEISCKTTFFHGTDDNVVPYSSGKKLFKKAPQEYASFISIKNGTHHNLSEFAIYEKTIFELLK